MNSIAERRLEEKGRRRAEILDAVEAVAATRGWDDMTMEEVARKARLSRALVYVYFKDKTDLMFGIGERSITALHREFDRAVTGHEQGLDQIRAVGRAYLEFSKAHPVYFAVLVRCELTSPDRVQPGTNEWSCMVAGDAVQDMMIAVIEKGIRDGSISREAGDARLIAVVLWGFLHGVIQLATSKANLLAHRGLDIAVLMEQALAQATRSVEARP